MASFLPTSPVQAPPGQAPSEARHAGGQWFEPSDALTATSSAVQAGGPDARAGLKAAQSGPLKMLLVRFFSPWQVAVLCRSAVSRSVGYSGARRRATNHSARMEKPLSAISPSSRLREPSITPLPTRIAPSARPAGMSPMSRNHMPRSLVPGRGGTLRSCPPEGGRRPGAAHLEARAIVLPVQPVAAVGVGLGATVSGVVAVGGSSPPMSSLNGG